MRETRVVRGSSWLSPRIQLFSDWKPSPSSIIDKPTLDPGYITRCRDSPLLRAICFQLTEDIKSCRTQWKGIPRGRWDYFLGESRLQGVGGLGADWAEGWTSPGDNWWPWAFPCLCLIGDWPALEAYSWILRATMYNWTLNLTPSDLPSTSKKIKWQPCALLSLGS